MKEGREQIEGKTNGRKEGHKAGGAVRETDTEKHRGIGRKEAAQRITKKSAVEKAWR
jgi:hypothetical protein